MNTENTSVSVHVCMCEHRFYLCLEDEEYLIEKKEYEPSHNI